MSDKDLVVRLIPPQEPVPGGLVPKAVLDSLMEYSEKVAGGEVTDAIATNSTTPDYITSDDVNKYYSTRALNRNIPEVDIELGLYRRTVQPNQPGYPDSGEFLEPGVNFSHILEDGTFSSSVYGDPVTLPPILVLAGTHEVLDPIEGWQKIKYSSGMTSKDWVTDYPLLLLGPSIETYIIFMLGESVPIAELSPPQLKKLFNLTANVFAYLPYGVKDEELFRPS